MSLDALVERDVLPDCAAPAGDPAAGRASGRGRWREAASRRSRSGSRTGSRPCGAARSPSRREPPTSSTTRCRPTSSSSCSAGASSTPALCGRREPTTSTRPRRRCSRLTGERAGLADGQRVLELGCGWGSLTLWAAERYPRSRITAVSNSASPAGLHPGRGGAAGPRQRRGRDRRHERLRAAAGLRPRRVGRDVRAHAQLRGAARADRLLARAGRPASSSTSSRHRHAAYPYEDRGPGDWMARHFFTGGQMPSHDLLLDFQRDLRVDRPLGGVRPPLRADLRGLARQPGPAPGRGAARPARDLRRGGGARWRARWRIFFLACAELFAWRGGEEWLVTHLRFRKPGA